MVKVLEKKIDDVKKECIKIINSRVKKVADQEMCFFNRKGFNGLLSEEFDAVDRFVTKYYGKDAGKDFPSIITSAYGNDNSFDKFHVIAIIGNDLLCLDFYHGYTLYVPLHSESIDSKSMVKILEKTEEFKN